MDLPPDYATTTGQQNSHFRPPPSLDVVRHPTQGGFVPKDTTRAAILNIKLSQPNRFTAGDTISGSVELTSDWNSGQNVPVGSISITFSGRCITSRPARESHTWRKTLQLFMNKDVLFVGPARIHAPSRSMPRVVRPKFPFQFSVPSTCTIVDADDFDTGPFFNHKINQVPPPSFADESDMEHAVVEYELTCELEAPNRKGHIGEGSSTQTLPLNVYNTRTVQKPSIKFSSHEKLLTHQSLDLLPPAERKYHERPLSLSQKLGFRSIDTDHQPKASFTATVFVPTMAVIGQPIPLMLYINHHTEMSTVLSPIVNLTKVQVFLLIETSICSIKHKSIKCKHDQTVWTNNVQIASKDFRVSPPQVENLDLREIMDLTLDPGLPPTFKSFNIARTYSLKVACTISCGGKFSTAGNTMTRCTFLARNYVPRLPGYDDPPPAENGEESLLFDNVPPPYPNSTELLGPGFAPGYRTQRSQSRSSESRSPNRAYHRHRWAANGAIAASTAASAAAASTSSAASSGGGGGGGGGC